MERERKRGGFVYMWWCNFECRRERFGEMVVKIWGLNLEDGRGLKYFANEEDFDRTHRGQKNQIKS